MPKSKRSKATDISQKVKKIVWERDGERCILCGSHEAMPNAHYISRSEGGLGIEQNVVTLCLNCHRKVDQTVKRKELLKEIWKYLSNQYPGLNEKDLIYKKGEIY